MMVAKNDFGVPVTEAMNVAVVLRVGGQRCIIANLGHVGYTGNGGGIVWWWYRVNFL